MTRRVMARPIPAPRKSRSREALVAGAILVALAVGFVGFSGILAGGPAQTPGRSSDAGQLPSATPPGLASPSPADTGSIDTPEPTAPIPTPSSEPTGTPEASTPGPTSPLEGAAPTSPQDFDLHGQVISIGFPLRADTRYHYRDNWLDVRDGSPDDYNHARVNAEGVLVRVHDGIDIYGAEGEPLIAPFSGTIIDPATRWQPWEPSRYGNTIVVMSDEPLSAGYLALLVHADKVWVEPGTHVSRGQVLGTLGRTGNAETQSISSHLHFELRAPFLIDWSPLGEDRAVDAFNPYPSLVAADPERT
jgi:murein DD-endopeptidase MepM/ murein hydrolase activator NlpD